MCSVVITRFLEPWQNIKELSDLFSHIRNNVDPCLVFTEAKFVIYNRGPAPTADERALLPPNTTIIETENIGRETYVIISYIISNYQSLPDTILFCPASWTESEYKKHSLLTALYFYNTYSFIPQFHKRWQDICDSVVDIWYGNTPSNVDAVKTMPFVKSDIRPFGAWYEARIKQPTGREWQNIIANFGIFAVRRDNITRYSKLQWEEWFSDISKSGPNTELAHYWEYSWASLLS